jgi:predicted nuclease with TOPRIM domain
MKKILCWALCVATLAGCELQTKREQALSAENDVLTTELTEKNQALEQAVQAIAQIQEGLLAINEAEGRVSIQSQGGEGLTDAERLKEDLLFIQKKMEDSRKQIENLQKQLKASGAESEGLRKVIANLQKELSDKTERILALQAQLAEKDIRIAELDNAVSMLTDDVNTLHQVSEAQQEVIEQQVLQLNTAWYVYGTAKELKEQNILRSGDVMLSTDFNHNYFTEIDVRVDHVFPLYSKHAQLLTTHPKGSYEFTKGPDKQLTLNILDFEAFWSVSRYMVIKVR